MKAIVELHNDGGAVIFRGSVDIEERCGCIAEPKAIACDPIVLTHSVRPIVGIEVRFIRPGDAHA